MGRGRPPQGVRGPTPPRAMSRRRRWRIQHARSPGLCRGPIIQLRVLMPPLTFGQPRGEDVQSPSPRRSLSKKSDRRHRPRTGTRRRRCHRRRLRRRHRRRCSQLRQRGARAGAVPRNGGRMRAKTTGRLWGRHASSHPSPKHRV